MSEIIIFTSVFFILFYSSVIHISYNRHWQFSPPKLVSNRLRSANSRSQVVSHQVPVEFSRPRQNRFEWEQICQIRYNKLYYQIILFSPTDHAKLNSTLKTTKINCNSQIEIAPKTEKSLKKTSSNKLIREQKRHNRCHSPNVPKGTQINEFNTLKPNNSTNQTSISGSHEFTVEDFTSGALQQISTGIAPTRSRPIENYSQQIFRQTYGLNPHANSAANRDFFHEYPAKKNFSAINNNSAIAAQPISFPNITAQEEIPSIARNQRNSIYHAKNNSTNNSNSTRDHLCAQYNFPNLSNFTQDDIYHAKNNLNGTKTNAQNIPLALHRNSTRDNMPPPVISTEHRSA